MNLERDVRRRVLAILALLMQYPDHVWTVKEISESVGRLLGVSNPDRRAVYTDIMAIELLFPVEVINGVNNQLMVRYYKKSGDNRA